MINQKELKKILNYNSDTGVFKWLERTCGRKTNGMVGHKDVSGYLIITINGRRYRAHQLAWLYIYGYFPKGVLDHKNRKKSDNRIKNLKETTHQQNLRNSKINSNNKSDVTGIDWYKPLLKWRARITLNGKTKYLGYFDNLGDAIKIRLKAEQKYDYPNYNINSSLKEGNSYGKTHKITR